MMTIALMFIKSLFSKAIALIQWAIENWKITLPIIAAIAVILFYKHHLNVVNERDQARSDYAAHLEQDNRDREIRKKANQEKEEKLAKELIATKNNHAAIILQLKGSYNEKLKHKDAAIANANTMRDILRRKLEEANAAARLSEGADRPVRLAEIRKDSNTAGAGQTDTDYINTLEYACALTTADYNTLYDRCEAVNRIFAN